MIHATPTGTTKSKTDLWKRAGVLNSKDNGVDFIVYLKDGTFVLIQVKYRSGRKRAKSGTTMSEFVCVCVGETVTRMMIKYTHTHTHTHRYDV